ncbi:MAG: ATP-grasp domain-containing protein [archaeon]|nr:ATP-grasp domain-containing protein [archaeon]
MAKILFIGSRLFDDVAYHANSLGVESILTESNENADNLDLASKYYIVPRGFDEPMKIAIEENVDAIIPLIGIDSPLMGIAEMKEKIEKTHQIPVIFSNTNVVSVAADKIKTKEFFKSIGLNVPKSGILNKKDFVNEESFLDKLGFNFPIVLKQGEGQGGKDICIATEFSQVEEYFSNFEMALIEEFIEGNEVSIEVICWNDTYVPLAPIYKGDTNLEGIHPISRLRKGPCDFDKISNEEIRDLARKIAINLKAEGTFDIDLIYSPERNIIYAIEINTRPSGTRYLSYACTGLSPLNLLIDIAVGDCDINSLESKIQHNYALEIPIGNYEGPSPNEPVKEFINGNYIVHGPKGYQRLTISAKTLDEAYIIAKELTGNDYS